MPSQQRAHLRASHMANPFLDSLWPVLLSPTQLDFDHQSGRGSLSSLTLGCHKGWDLLAHSPQRLEAWQYLSWCQFKRQTGWFWPRSGAKSRLCLRVDKRGHPLLHEPRADKWTEIQWEERYMVAGLSHLRDGCLETTIQSSKLTSFGSQDQRGSVWAHTITLLKWLMEDYPVNASAKLGGSGGYWRLGTSSTHCVAPWLKLEKASWK